MSNRIYKKFVPCMYLYQGKLVNSFQDRTVVHMNPAEAARFYGSSNADELIVFDLSDNDAEHEEALSVIKKICSVTDIPVTGAGNIRRMEDVKKLLYAGCRKAALNYAKPGNIEMTEEVSKRFGRDKIAACFETADVLRHNRNLLEECTAELICVNGYHSKESVGICHVPMLIMMSDVSLDKMMEHLNMPGVSGITGEIINANAKELSALKMLCMDNGIAVNTYEAAYAWRDFKLNSDGMIPVVVQDYKTNEVLMAAYMNEEAYLHTIKTGKMTYYSRSRQELWIKGDTSGHYQYVKALTADCDMDTILAKVSQVGNACHTGAYSCFFNEIMKKEYDDTNPLKVFEDVFAVIKDRKVHPKEGSYTNYLFDKGIDKILKKLGEEATEIVIAAKNPNTNEIKYEISDFLYHMMVLMVEKGVTWEEITTELAQR